MTSSEWYDCENDNNNTSPDNIGLIQCSETIGYSPRVFTFLLFVFPLFGLITNVFLIFAFLSKKKQARKL